MACFLATLYFTWRAAAWSLAACGEWRRTVAVLTTLWVGSSLLNACRTVSPPQQRPSRAKADGSGGDGSGSSVPAEAATRLANGRAHSGSLRGSSAVQRSSANNLAATDIF